MTQLENPDRAREQLSTLLKQAGEGSRDAFAHVYNLTSAKLFGVCLRILGNKEAAEDVLQDVYVKIWRNSSRFDASKASPITWLATIARNTSIDRRRATGKWNMVSDDILAEKGSGEESALDNMMVSQDNAALNICLDSLEERQRHVIRTAFFEGLSYNELAQQMDTPLGTVKSWVRRGLIKLRGCLDNG